MSPVLPLVLIGLVSMAGFQPTSQPATQSNPAPVPMRTAFSPDAKVKIALVGDSTVTEHAGWGIGFQIALSDGAEAVNIAKGGRSSLSYRTEGWWEKALALEPDYMLIQFGHNDQPGKGPERETDPATTFPQNLARYIDEARAAGIKPILVTSLSRRDWKEDGKIHSSLLPWVEATRRVAKQMDVPLIDLFDRSVEVYYSLGREGTRLISVVREDGTIDNTHLNSAGSECFGTMVADDLKRAVPELDRYLQGYKQLAMQQQRAAQATQPAPQTTTAPPARHPYTVASTLPAEHRGEKTIVVAPDGTGAFTSLQDAIDSAPENNLDRTTIRLKPGLYYGPVVIPRNRTNLSLIGDDRATTILTYALNVKDPITETVIPKMNGNGVIVLGDGFRAKNLTFRNTSGDHGQAMALRMQADRCVIENCTLLGWQDTLLVHSKRQYFKDCYIEGRVDFIYGGSTAVFEDCQIRSKKGGYVTAASTPQENPFGFVFLNCRLTSDDNVPTYLGRPWRPFASVTFVGCEMGSHIRPEGWHNWGKPENETTARYAEFGCTGTGAATGGRVPWVKTGTIEEAKDITARQVLAGEDGWDPTQE